MSVKWKKIIKPAVIISMIIALFVVAFQFVAVSTEGMFTEAGGCIAIVFDKADVMGADKIVVYAGEGVVTITDESLVKEIASNFVVANRTALCDERSGDKMEIYNGGRLVRTVYWSGCVDNLAQIYKEDALHWIPSEGTLGQVELPEEVYNRITQIIREQLEGA